MWSELLTRLGLDRFEWAAPQLIELHAAAAHFPIALLLTSVAFEVLGLLRRKASLRDAAFYTHLAGVAGAAVTVALGWFGNPWRFKHNEIAQNVNVHKWWGVAVLMTFTLLAFWRGWQRLRGGEMSRSTRVVFALITLLGVAVVSITGYLGGQLAGAG